MELTFVRHLEDSLLPEHRVQFLWRQTFEDFASTGITIIVFALSLHLYFMKTLFSFVKTL
jgi:hypothetical protein